MKYGEGFVFDPLMGRWEEVEPCPFCACKKLQVSRLYDKVAIRCSKCGAKGPEVDLHVGPAILAWNNRGWGVQAVSEPAAEAENALVATISAPAPRPGSIERAKLILDRVSEAIRNGTL